MQRALLTATLAIMAAVSAALPAGVVSATLELGEAKPLILASA
jgi:hypothetical protein